jgi:hypothetical protein
LIPKSVLPKRNTDFKNSARDHSRKMVSKTKSSNSVIMDNQIKEEKTENSHRFLKRKNSDDKLKKANDDLEPILVDESRKS